MALQRARNDRLYRLDGKHIVAGWLLSSNAVALVELAARSPDILAHLSAWRAAAVPLLVAAIGGVAGWRLLRHGDGVRLAVIALMLPTFALSIGALAYRLDVGPFVRMSLTASGVTVAAGSDARLLLIVGAGNHVPSGMAINLATLTALAVLGTSLDIPLNGTAREHGRG